MGAVRVRFLTLAVASGALLIAHAAHAQLPDEVRAAGITAAQWTVVQVQVQHYAADKHVSERALSAVCAKMGIELARGHRFDLGQMISLIGERADEIDALYQRLSLEEQENNPAAAALLKDARVAIDAGDLDHAEDLLKQASAAARASVEAAVAAAAEAERQEAEITATDAQVKALQLDYLGAAQAYAEAARELPADDAHGRWAYIDQQAEMLENRGERFVEPQALTDAVALYRDTALPLVPRGADPVDWAKTENGLGVALRVLGERGDDAALHDAVAAFHAALEVDTRDRDPAVWATDQQSLATALWRLGERSDDQALRDAVAAYRAALEVDTRERDPEHWARDMNNLGNPLRELGGRCDTAALRDAVATYRAVLEVWTRDRDPKVWAMVQNNLGVALLVSGEQGDQAAMRLAVAADRAALEVYTRDRDPAHWAMAETNVAL